MEPLRILLVDDHPLFRDGLRALLRSLTAVEVVAEATTGTDAVEAATRLLPDIVVMDLNLPELNGIEATRQIIAASPHVRVLVLTMFDDDESLFAAMRAGARGYILKGANQAEIARAIHAVGNGEAVFGPVIAQKVLDSLRTSRPSAPYYAFPELTQREREVLELIALGINNQTIAYRLRLSPKTVRNHVSNIFSKLQVIDRSEAIIRGRQAGFGESADR